MHISVPLKLGRVSLKLLSLPGRGKLYPYPFTDYLLVYLYTRLLNNLATMLMAIGIDGGEDVNARWNGR